MIVGIQIAIKITIGCCSFWWNIIAAFTRRKEFPLTYVSQGPRVSLLSNVLGFASKQYTG